MGLLLDTHVLVWALDKPERLSLSVRQELEDQEASTGCKTALNFLSLDVAIYARNLVDKDAREPSESATSLPFDLPIAGRSIFGEIN